MQVKLNFNQHKKNFTCEALVVVALKKKLKTFNHFFKTFSKNYSKLCKNPVNSYYKQYNLYVGGIYDRQLKKMKGLLAGRH